MTVSEQIIQVLTYLGEKFGIMIDWSSENVIPYITTLCQKLISYEIWTSVAWIGIMTILATISIIITIRYRIFSWKFIEDHDFVTPLLYSGFIILWVAAVICIVVQIFDIIKCTTFPEMYVFEYINNIIKNAN